MRFYLEKRLLPYFQPRLWPCSQHRAMWYIAGHKLWECCAAGQAGDYRFVPFVYLKILTFLSSV
jgi:hypothetical protein